MIPVFYASDYKDLLYLSISRYAKSSEARAVPTKKLKVLNDTKLLLNDKRVTHAHLGPIGIIQYLQRSPTPQTIFLV